MFGAELRRRRLELGLSLAELAKLVHYHRSYLCKVENGLKSASISVARRCDVALGADGALAELASYAAAVGTRLADSSDVGDGVWMLSLAQNGVNQFVPASGHVTPALGAGFDIHYQDISATDKETSSVFQSLFHECVRLGEAVGSSGALPTVIAQVHVLRNLAAKAPYVDQRTLLVLAGRYAEYAGWIAQEAGDDRAALWRTNLTADITDQAACADLAAFACARRAEIALYCEDAVQSISLARQAQQDCRVQPRIRGFAALREAQALALCGDYGECRRALDRATDLVDTDPTAMLGGIPVPPLGSPAPGNVTGWCLHDLGRVQEATTVLDREIILIPKCYRHAVGRYRVRRILAHAASG